MGYTRGVRHDLFILQQTLTIQFQWCLCSYRAPSRMKRTEQDPDTLKEALKVNDGSLNTKINNIKICLLILFLLYLFFLLYYIGKKV